MSSTRFMYVDDSGAVQGPFTGAELLGWLAEGFFTPETPLWPAPVGESDEACTAAAEKAREQFKPFHTFFPQTKRAIAAPAAVAVAEPVATIAPAVAAAAPVAVTAAQPSVAVSAPALEVVAPVPVPAVPVVSPPSTFAVAAAATSPIPRPVTPVPAIAPVPAEWYYLDDEGNERGPHPSGDIAEWIAGGYFADHTKLRKTGETEFRTLGEHAPTEPQFAKASATAAAGTATGAVAAVNIEDQFETDMMDDDDDAGAGDGSQAGSGNEDVEAGDEGATEEGKVAGDAVLTAAKKKPGVSVSLAPSSMRWYYVDKSGTEQGPFTAVSMLKWHRVGFFAHNDTPLRREDEPKALTLAERTSAPSFYTAELPSTLDSTVQKENRWYYLDAADEEQGPFTEAQMRGWWQAKYLKPTLRVRQVGEPESAFSPISTRDCAFTRDAPAPPPAPLHAQVPPQPVPYAYPQHVPHAQHAYAYPPPPQHAQHPYAPAPAHPYGYAPPPQQHSAAYAAAAAGGYAGYAPYGGAPSGYPGAAPPPRAHASGDYSQSMAFSGHRGRGRHVVGAAYGEQRHPHDPLAQYVAPASVDAWANANKRPRY